MAGLDFIAAQDEIRDWVELSLPNIPVVTGAFPVAESLPFKDGILEPYIILRFTDPMPASGGATFYGPTNDEYYSYFDVFSIAGDDRTAREVASTVNRVCLGKSLPNVSSISKIFGGGRYTILSEANRQPLAFITTSSFRYGTNFEDVGAGSLV